MTNLVWNILRVRRGLIELFLVLDNILEFEPGKEKTKIEHFKILFTGVLNKKSFKKYKGGENVTMIIHAVRR